MLCNITHIILEVQNVSRTNNWVYQDHRIYGQYKKTTCFLYNSYKQLKTDIFKDMPFTLVPKHSLNTWDKFNEYVWDPFVKNHKTLLTEILKELNNRRDKVCSWMGSLRIINNFFSFMDNAFGV